MRASTLSLLTGAVFLGTACSPANDSAATSESAAGVAAATSVDAGAARASIDSLNARISDALERGDTTTLAEIYTDDAVIMMSNMEAARGRDGAKKVWSTMLSQGTLKDVSMKTDDIVVGGDLVVETGKYELTVQPKTGKEMKDKGKYVVVWKRQPDGSLKIFRDIGNSDLPATQ
jgi:ketosteroid isomerase-like protein